MGRMELLRKAKAGDQEAKGVFIETQFPLINFALGGYYKRYPHLQEDLFQVGCLGILHAIRRFDPDRGIKWSTYAVPTIVGTVKKYLSVHEHAGGLKIPASKVGAVMRGELQLHVNSLDMTVPTDSGEVELRDTIGVEDDRFGLVESRADIMTTLGQLDRRVQEAVLRKASGQTQRELGAAVGYSQAHASRLIRKARELHGRG